MVVGLLRVTRLAFAETFLSYFQKYKIVLTFCQVFFRI